MMDNTDLLQDLPSKCAVSPQHTDSLQVGEQSELPSRSIQDDSVAVVTTDPLLPLQVESFDENEQSTSLSNTAQTIASQSSPATATVGDSTCSEHRPISTEEETCVSESDQGTAVEDDSGACSDSRQCATEDTSEQNSATDVADGEDQMEREEPSWYTLADDLKLLTGSYKEFDSDNYLRGCKWAPDGSCLLTCSDDNKMRLYNLPSELYSGVVDSLPEMTPVFSVPQGEAVYDYCWYPKMSSWEPSTCCFLTTCKDHPVHLWDAFYHHKRASYIAYNHVDEVTSPHSVCFSLDGEKIYTGFNKCLRVFNTTRPGRECTTMATYEKKYGGQAGIISCISMNPAIPGMFALGSYSCSVGLYDDSVYGTTMLLSGVHSGVTHMLFSQDGNYLFIGYRKNGKILCWDLRHADRVLYTTEREVNTNQRIYFDLYSSGKYLISGSTSSHVYGWRVDSGAESHPNEDSVLPPCLKTAGHTDAVNGCSVHPTLPLLATSSGQRRFLLPASDSEGSSESEGEDMELDKVMSENSVKIWSLLGTSHCGSYSQIQEVL